MVFAYGAQETGYLKRRDKRLGAVIERVGHIERAVDPDLFSSVVHHIVGQQVSMRAQATIWGRLQAALGTVDAPSVAALDVHAIQGMGMSMRKAGYILDFARRVQSGEFPLEAVRAMDDAQAIAALTSLKGVGVWTAEMILLFCLQRPDVLSYDDLAIRRGLRMLYRHKTLDRARFERYRRRYSPCGSVASLYLWRWPAAPSGAWTTPPPRRRRDKGRGKQGWPVAKRWGAAEASQSPQAPHGRTGLVAGVSSLLRASYQFPPGSLGFRARKVQGNVFFLGTAILRRQNLPAPAVRAAGENEAQKGISPPAPGASQKVSGMQAEEGVRPFQGHPINSHWNPCGFPGGGCKGTGFALGNGLFQHTRPRRTRCRKAQPSRAPLGFACLGRPMGVSHCPGNPQACRPGHLMGSCSPGQGRCMQHPLPIRRLRPSPSHAANAMGYLPAASPRRLVHMAPVADMPSPPSRPTQPTPRSATRSIPKRRQDRRTPPTRLRYPHRHVSISSAAKCPLAAIPGMQAKPAQATPAARIARPCPAPTRRTGGQCRKNTATPQGQERPPPAPLQWHERRRLHAIAVKTALFMPPTPPASGRIPPRCR